MDFPDGVRFSTLAVRRAYGGAGESSVPSESSVEVMDDEEEEACLPRKRAGGDAARDSASAAAGSPERGGLYAFAMAERRKVEKRTPDRSGDSSGPKVAVALRLDDSPGPPPATRLALPAPAPTEDDSLVAALGPAEAQR